MSNRPETDVTIIRPMKTVDLPAAFSLSAEVGWNQSAADWQRMLQMEPEGCFVAECAGNVVGTTLCCVFGTVAWLAMVIVSPSHRGRGLGRTLVQRGLDYTQQVGVASVRLDATPLGERVYRQVGFHAQFELIRMCGVSTMPSTHIAASPFQIVPATSSDVPDILQWDARATRTDRSKLLSRLCDGPQTWFARSASGETVGFLARRQGRLAEQFGPCCGSPESSLPLLRHALAASRGHNLIVDIPAQRNDLLAVAAEFGLTSQRTLLRMCCGPTVREDDRYFHISYGGEFG